MAKKDAIGNAVPFSTKRGRGRSKPIHRRGSKKLGPKDPDRGNRGKH
jgi:hypothetical protein